MEFASYITGFVDGEGCFSVSFNVRKKIKTGVEVRPSFSISQHKRSKKILIDIRNYFGVGEIRYSTKDENYKYEVRSIIDLTEIIIPHFVKYPLKTAKKDDYFKFRIICQMISKGFHLKSDKLFEIVDLAYKMNKSGKRIYSKKKLLKLITR